MNSEILLVCPNCRIELTNEDTNLHCPSCTHQWIIEKNVLWFSRSSPYWGEIDQPSIQRLNSMSREKGGEYALCQVAPQLRNYATDSSLDWWGSLRALLPDRTALAAGAGRGAICFP